MAQLKRLSFILFFISLFGCGGGGSLNKDGNPTDPDEKPITLALEISNQTVNASEGAVITVTIKQDGAAVSNKLVTFTIDDNVDGDTAVFTNDNATSSTNSDGVAQIGIKAGALAGDGRVVATIDSGESGSIVYSSLGGGGEEVPQVATVGLFTSTQQLASSGAQGIELTAIVKDADNNLISGAEVAFSSNSGELQVTNAITGEDGKAKAVLNSELDKSNRTIEVKAISNMVSSELNVYVVGTAINISGSSSLAINDDNNFIIKLLDSDGNGIGGKTIALSAGNGSANLTLPASVITDANGQATVSVTGTTGGANTIIASALGASDEKSVTVQADSFLFTSFDNGNSQISNPSTSAEVADVLLSDTAEIKLTWLRAGEPVADGTVVNFTTTRGTLVSSTATTLDGIVTARLNSNNAGKALVTFSGVDGEVSLENQLEFEFVAETAATLVAQASPASIGPNGQQSTISVTVKDANGNLVKNKTVDFSLTDTSNGSIFPASAVTDSNGNASTVYTSSSVSALDGVRIDAVVSGTSVGDFVEITVADRELFISLGTGNVVLTPDNSTYNKQYTVFVVDADSTPRPNVDLTISAVPTHYYKGVWERFYIGSSFKWWYPEYSVRCVSEDDNRDGILDFGEDINNDGELTPGNIVAASGNVTTDENGQAVIDIIYPRSYATWVDIELVARTKVTGTESRTKVNFNLPVFVGDVSNEDVSPPSINGGSPFGFGPNCTDTD